MKRWIGLGVIADNLITEDLDVKIYRHAARHSVFGFAAQ
jgi:hypothetical protein